AAVYGPQKGATPEMVQELDAALAHFADVVEGVIGRSLRELPGAGAAGGLGFGLMAFAGARLQRGIELALETLQADRHLAWASLVITRAGRLDRETLQGKGPCGGARRAAAFGVPVVAVAGCVGSLTPEELDAFRAAGLAAIIPVVESPCTLDEAMNPDETRKR